MLYIFTEVRMSLPRHVACLHISPFFLSYRHPHLKVPTISSRCITCLIIPACQVVFQTKIYHPGINEEGSICVPILRDEVSPRISLDLGNAIALWREIVDELLMFRLLCVPIVCRRSGNHPSHCQPVSRVNFISCPLFLVTNKTLHSTRDRSREAK
jgi:hypothetical protein